jgi:hypothetical protein
MIEVGETFTISAANDQNFYSWGTIFFKYNCYNKYYKSIIINTLKYFVLNIVYFKHSQIYLQ